MIGDLKRARKVRVLQQVLLLCAGFYIPAHAIAAVSIISKPIAGGPDAALFAGFEGNPSTNLNALTKANGDSYWVSYSLGFKLTAGEKIGTVNGTITTSGASGGFLQRWNFDFGANTYTLATPISTNTSNGDSHLIAGSIVLTPNTN